jgi:hypothetical protein
MTSLRQRFLTLLGAALGGAVAVTALIVGALVNAAMLLGLSVVALYDLFQQPQSPAPLRGRQTADGAYTMGVRGPEPDAPTKPQAGTDSDL